MLRKITSGLTNEKAATEIEKKKQFLTKINPYCLLVQTPKYLIKKISNPTQSIVEAVRSKNAS